MTSKDKANKSKRSKVFVSYSHKDGEWMNLVREHLDTLSSEGIQIELWNDTRIKAGEHWRSALEASIEETKVAVLLVSTRFLASDFIYNNVLPPLLNWQCKKEQQ